MNFSNPKIKKIEHERRGKGIIYIDAIYWARNNFAWLVGSILLLLNSTGEEHAQNGGCERLHIL